MSYMYEAEQQLPSGSEASAISVKNASREDA